jgi:iron complex transport system ATP-binding protein
MSMLRVENLTASLGGREVLREVSFTLGGGEFVGLLGPNGAGKSTLLKAMLGLTPAGGHVAMDGRHLGGLSPSARARLMAYLPQERDVAWNLTAEAVVALGRTPWRGPMQPFLHRSKWRLQPESGKIEVQQSARARTHERSESAGAGQAEDDRAIREAMARTDVLHLRGRSIADMSGGERNRTLIARALAQEAPLLLADEPVAGLDPAHQIAAMELFASLADNGGTVLITLHELHLAARWCRRLLVLDKGRLVADGTPADVLTPERLAAVYGVEAYRAETPHGLVVTPIARRHDPAGQG